MTEETSEVEKKKKLKYIRAYLRKSGDKIVRVKSHYRNLSDMQKEKIRAKNKRRSDEDKTNNFSEESVRIANQIHANVVKEVLYAWLPKWKADELITEIEHKLDDEIAAVQVLKKDEDE